MYEKGTCQAVLYFILNSNDWDDFCTSGGSRGKWTINKGRKRRYTKGKIEGREL